MIWLSSPKYEWNSPPYISLTQWCFLSSLRLRKDLRERTQIWPTFKSCVGQLSFLCCMLEAMTHYYLLTYIWYYKERQHAAPCLACYFCWLFTTKHITAHWSLLSIGVIRLNLNIVWIFQITHSRITTVFITFRTFNLQRNHFSNSFQMLRFWLSRLNRSSIST